MWVFACVGSHALVLAGIVTGLTWSSTPLVEIILRQTGFILPRVLYLKTNLAGNGCMVTGFP